MNGFREIAELNGCAVSLLQNGEAERARCTFVEALRRLQTLCHSGQDTEILLEDDSPLVYSEIWGNYSATFSVEVATAQHDLLDPEASHIYSRAFLLVNDIPVTAIETTAILLFNTGLVHHEEGVRTGKSANIKHALEFYKRSFALLDDDVHHVIAILVLMGALCHNMAHCYSSFFQKTPFHSMIKKLTQIVRWLASAAEELDEYEDFEFFHASLFFAECTNFRFAPAA